MKIVVTILACVIVGVVFMREVNETELIRPQLIEYDKIWKIEFSDEVDFDEDIYQSIQVKDSKNQVLKTWLVLGEDGKSVMVKHYQGAYIEGESYTLTVSDKIRSITGKPLKPVEPIHFLVKKQVFEVEKLVDNGEDINKLTLVFMGDGYTAEEQDKFKEDIQMTVDKMFMEEPFDRYKDNINVYIIKVISNFSGVSINREDIQDTYFGTSLYFNGRKKGNVGATKVSRVYSCLRDSEIQYDRAFVVMNTKEHGGTARGKLAYFTATYDMWNVFMHEFGHSFGKLVDEYYHGKRRLREGVNSTRESDPKKVPWKDLVGKDGIDVYPIGNTKGWYIPSYKCKMKSNGWPFVRCVENI